jgi:hypothetical protein
MLFLRSFTDRDFSSQPLFFRAISPNSLVIIGVLFFSKPIFMLISPILSRKEHSCLSPSRFTLNSHSGKQFHLFSLPLSPNVQQMAGVSDSGRIPANTEQQV